MSMRTDSAHDDTVTLHAELRRLRRRLADAWWYEEPLEVIEQLEAEIARHEVRLADAR